ncbi:MAG: DUF484 family protein [Rhodocyclaceae bacterium]|nr:DUF484 family protein [Rhodocyclaceae bacterium]
MKPDDVARYLQGHPEFFEQYAELLSQLHIPSPHGGRAVSITERQIGTLREKVRELERKLAELIRFGEENDGIGEKVHRLGVALYGARDADQVLRLLQEHLTGDFAVPHAAVRLWGMPGEGEAFAEVPEEVRDEVAGLDRPWCGPAPGQPAAAWFGEAAGHLRSMALVPLDRNGETLGMLVLASEEGQRFYSGMGTLYLERIGDIAAAALAGAGGR